MLRVGLTGGIGSGKSLVADQLGRCGAWLIDSDQIAREVVQPGTPGLRAVVDEFGEAILTEDGTLDRSALAARVFDDADARSRLNAIVHPLVAARSAERAATSGCTIALSRLRASASSNTRAASADRSSVPSSVRIASPNSSTTARNPGVPGWTTSRAIWSESMSHAPHRPSWSATSDLPDPIPPVSPTLSIGQCGRSTYTPPESFSRNAANCSSLARDPPAAVSLEAGASVVVEE